MTSIVLLRCAASRFVSLVMIFVAGSLTTLACAAPPNVVLIISDDQAWTDFGFMGHPHIRTPNLDRLASQSALFTRGYVPTSLCRASLATLATGQYPHQHAITSNDPPPGADRSLMLRHMSRADTLMRRLAEVGYLSHQSGKWWEGHHALGGFTHGMTHGDPTRRGRHGDVGLAIGRKGLAPIDEFLDQTANRPFLLWYAPFLPHTPHTPPQRILEHYSKPDRPPRLASYWAMCEWFDESVGALLDLLDRRGLTNDTIVAFVTDNGWIQQTGPTRTNQGWFAAKSKRSPYDGGVRTPIMLRWPDHIAPARHDHLASSVDLAGTLLRATTSGGAESDRHARQRLGDPDAVDLIAVAAGSKSPRSMVFGETFTHDAVDIDRPAANLQFRWCIENDWKLIRSADQAVAAELYHITNDPHENANVASEQADRVRHLTEKLDNWWRPEMTN